VREFWIGIAFAFQIFANCVGNNTIVLKPTVKEDGDIVQIKRVHGKSEEYNLRDFFVETARIKKQ
jgi:hypothetical protein